MSNILTFSASPRKIWVQEFNKILNPSYWLLGRLMVELAKHESVYTLPTSMNPVGRILPYKPQIQIDKIIITGVAYSPSNCQGSFNKGYPLHQRAFDLADQLKPIIERYNPHITLLTVDVRGWYEDALKCFGFTPHVTISEQQLGWAKIGYYMTNILYHQNQNQNQNQITKKDQICFTGNAKKREKKLLGYFVPLSKHLPIIIDGGGYQAQKDQTKSEQLKQVNPFPNMTFNGMRMFNDSVQLMLASKYSLVMHEPLGEQHGWITAKFFENLGSRTISFVDNDYDKNFIVIPKNHILRVSSPKEMLDKINNIGYTKLLEHQNKLIDPRWEDISYYFDPLHEIIKLTDPHAYSTINSNNLEGLTNNFTNLNIDNSVRG